MKIYNKIKALTLSFFCILLTLICYVSPAEARSSTSDAFIAPVYRSMSENQINASKETCIQCHRRVTPKEVDHYNKSSHKKIGLDCSGCHGKDHSSMPLVTGKTVCIKCHAKETKEMLASNHAKSWGKMWDNARYWSISKAMRMQGCVRCHDISIGFNDVRCDYCHSTHEFSVQEAKNPATCSTCHMGPDHPQAEAYETSGHGKAFAISQVRGSSNSRQNVSCVTCHQPNGSHNVSQNIGIGGVSNGGILEDWSMLINEQGKPKLKRKIVTKDKFDQARQGNINLCNNCHSQDFNGIWLNNADQIKLIVEERLLKAQEIVQDLNKKNLLLPSPKDRQGNPVEGSVLVLGGNQLYVGTSKAEAIYFQMYKFAAAQGWKSAYHQNFNRAGLEGMKELERLMRELEKEAKVLELNDSLNKTTKNEKANQVRPNYLKALFFGILFGTGLAITIKLLSGRERKKIFGWFVFILFINSGLFLAPSKALAWGEDPKNQTLCVKCHDENVKELKAGPHSSLQCLNCHKANADLKQVRNPEVCRKCHSGTKGYQWESYITSPHGVQYRIKGDNPWVPTCITCHVQKGNHSLRTNMGKSKPYTGDIGEVCLNCHTNDDILKFSKDLSAINVENQSLIRQFEAIGDKLIREGILVNNQLDIKSKLSDVNFQWWEEKDWQMANAEKLSSEEQIITSDLLKQLINKTRFGTKEAAKKLRTGIAHVNPDYTHWYGYAYLNLSLSEVNSTAQELNILANHAKLIADREKEVFHQELYVALGTMVLSFLLLTYVRLPRKKIQD